MDNTFLYLLAADTLLIIHVLFVVFVVVGLLLIFIAKMQKWRWVRSPWFRIAHLVGIAIVVVQSWLGIICPLTTWEMALREHAGEAVYAGSFISHWLSTLLYYHAPEWVFAVVYSAFGILVLLSWIWVRPNSFRK
ncbi:MAG: glucan phosphoethanolaminetransferase (alkaline phosphatase superfamily) [Alphaproteobacteria bacterium]|jgi:glucan phosphoethanolaminetransferase (alkaline phosphatase superfamily)